MEYNYYERGNILINRADVPELEALWIESLGLGTTGLLVRSNINKMIGEIADANVLPRTKDFKELLLAYKKRKILEEPFEDLLEEVKESKPNHVRLIARLLPQRESLLPEELGTLAYYILAKTRDTQFRDRLVEKPTSFLEIDLQTSIEDILDREGITGKFERESAKRGWLSFYVKPLFDYSPFNSKIRRILLDKIVENHDLDTGLFLIEKLNKNYLLYDTSDYVPKQIVIISRINDSGDIAEATKFLETEVLPEQKEDYLQLFSPEIQHQLKQPEQ